MGISETSVAKVAYKILPYTGKIGAKDQKYLKVSFKNLLTKEVEIRILYTGTNHRSKFKKKQQQKTFKQQHYLAYHVKSHD